MAYDAMLVDGGWLLWRSVFSSVAEPSIEPASRFLSYVVRSARVHDASGVRVCWDGGKEERRAIDPEYKVGRRGSEDADEETQELKERTRLDLVAVLPLLGVEQYVSPGWEADDTMTTLAREYEERGMRVLVLSGDKDLLQVVTRKTHLCRPTRSGVTVVWHGSFREYAGIDPTPDARSAWAAWQALRGDPTDGYSGVRGVGEKGATEALRAYPDVLDRMLRRDPLDRIATTRTRNLLRSPTAVREAAHAYSLALLRDDVDVETVGDAPRFDLPAAIEELRDLGAMEVVGQRRQLRRLDCSRRKRRRG